MTQGEVQLAQSKVPPYSAALQTLLNALNQNRQPTDAERQAARDELDALIKAGDALLS